jgi:hypothetical protein
VKEFGEFREFCEKEIGKRPIATRVDLAKIDLLVEGPHWKGLPDLAVAIPWLNPFSKFSTSGEPGIALRFSEDRKKGRLSVSLDIGLLEPDGADSPVRVVKIESRIGGVEAADCAASFAWCNDELNDVFAALIPEDQRRKRFD